MANLKREQLRTLKSFRANGHPVISVYWTLKRGPSDATLLELKNMTAVADDVRTHWREGNVEPHGQLSTDVPREDEIHRMAQDQFRHHQQDWQHKHVKQTSERLLSHLQGQNFKGLWVGAKEDVARALESNLHSYLKEKWCGQFPIDIHAHEPEIRERIAPP